MRTDAKESIITLGGAKNSAAQSDYTFFISRVSIRNA